MHSLSELNTMNGGVNQKIAYAKEFNDFMSTKQILDIQKNLAEIKDVCTVDYSKPLDMSEQEKANLKQLLRELINEKKDNFNSHYIQLLAWHIHELNVISVKRRGAVCNVTFMEYSPSPLLPITHITRLFRLFLPKRINTEKVSTALLLNYLNNYETASQRFKKILNAYLKYIQYSKNTDVYFDFNNVISYIDKKTPDKSKFSYPERLKFLGIRENTIKTRYFYDSLKGFWNDEKI